MALVVHDLVKGSSPEVLGSIQVLMCVSTFLHAVLIPFMILWLRAAAAA